MPNVLARLPTTLADPLVLSSINTTNRLFYHVEEIVSGCFFSVPTLRLFLPLPLPRLSRRWPIMGHLGQAEVSEEEEEEEELWEWYAAARGSSNSIEEGSIETTRA